MICLKARTGTDRTGFLLQKNNIRHVDSVDYTGQYKLLPQVPASAEKLTVSVNIGQQRSASSEAPSGEASGLFRRADQSGQHCAEPAAGPPAYGQMQDAGRKAGASGSQTVSFPIIMCPAPSKGGFVRNVPLRTRRGRPCSPADIQAYGKFQSLPRKKSYILVKADTGHHILYLFFLFCGTPAVHPL